MMTSAERRPDSTEFAPSHAPYVSLVPEGDVLAYLQAQIDECRELLGRLARRADYRYGSGKWSVKEVLGHILDAERVFAYRALCAARGEHKALPGFDENEYAANSDLSGVPLEDLLEQFTSLRRSNILFFRSLPENAWGRRAVANGSPITPRGTAYVIAGHVRHHCEILRDRYLAALKV